MMANALHSNVANCYWSGTEYVINILLLAYEINFIHIDANIRHQQRIMHGLPLVFFYWG